MGGSSVKEPNGFDAVKKSGGRKRVYAVEERRTTNSYRKPLKKTFAPARGGASQRKIHLTNRT